jgi:hypothetical protein
MADKKINCWEFMKCQREPGGAKAAEYGTCVAATDPSYKGINAGKNAGRICWAVAGTCCGGKIQGTFAEKRDSCTECPFYRLVQEEENTSGTQHKLLNYFSEDEKRFLASKVRCKVIEAGDHDAVLKADSAADRKLATMFLLYKDEHQPELNRMMEVLCEKVNKLGVSCRAADFKEI